MPPTTIIDNAEQIEEIMAGAVGPAERGSGTRAVHRASVRLDRGLTVEASARGFRLLVDEPEAFGGANAGRPRGAGAGRGWRLPGGHRGALRGADGDCDHAL